MTWFRVGGAGIPAALKNAMNAVLNKKFGTSGQNYPPNQWPDEVNLMGPLPEGTASGPIANITDGADLVPIKLWNSNVDASVDGVSEVNVVRTGKNIVNVTFSDYNASNIMSNVFSLKAGTYTLSLIYNGTPTWGIYLRDGSAINSPVLFNKYNDTTLTFTLSEDKETLCITMYYANGIASSEVSNVQIEVGSAPTQYTAYEAPTTHTVSLGRTIHGGSLEFISGAGTDENGVNFTFDPISPIPETENVCNFWTNVGSSSIVYRRDIDLALQAASSSRGLMMASRPVTQLVGEESDPDQVNELVEDDENDIREQLNEVVENDETEQEGEDDAR